MLKGTGWTCNIYLAREAETGSNSAHCSRHEVIQVAISWCGELQGPKADIVQSFVVNTVGLVGVFYQLMNGQCSIVRLDNGIRHFG